MTRAFRMDRPEDIKGYGVIEVILLCDRHTKTLQYEEEPFHDIEDGGCVICRTARWDTVRRAHLLTFREPVDAPLTPEERVTAQDVPMYIPPHIWELWTAQGRINIPPLKKMRRR